MQSSGKGHRAVYGGVDSWVWGWFKWCAAGLYKVGCERLWGREWCGAELGMCRHFGEEEYKRCGTGLGLCKVVGVAGVDWMLGRVVGLR